MGKILSPPARIGIIGGGQLGRMITVAAKQMGYGVIVLDPTPSSPAGQVADGQIVAAFTDKQAYRELAEQCDVLTYEFEHIDADILMELEEQGFTIYPSGGTLQKIQDKFVQKTFLRAAGVPTPKFIRVHSKQDISQFIEEVGLPLVLKTCSGGYDGKGNYVLRSKDEVDEALDRFEGCALLAEEFIRFDREISIIAARNLDREIVYYPIVQNVHEDSILSITQAPAELNRAVEEKIIEIAKTIVEVFDDYGTFCIELFLTDDGEVYLNEVAPRPHNSGHYTIEACATSQFEQVVRIVAGLPLGSVKLYSPCAMVNILGDDSVDGTYCFEGIEKVLAEDEVYLHIYGKSNVKKGKKIGHITALGDTVGRACAKAEKALRQLNIRPL